MEWRDEAIVLGRRAHGEHAAVATLFARAHGRHLGLARGGGHSKSTATFEPGNRVDALWRARLPEHLGNWTCELVEAIPARLMDAPAKLEALASSTAILDAVLPEREPHEGLYDATRQFLDRFDEDDWREAYVRWECRCLADLGFGLDLESCAATGAVDDLRYVSPKTGRAVSGEAGAPYADRLFPLPGFLRGTGNAASAELVLGLDIAGHFLDRHVLAPQSKTLPGARVRLYERWRRESRRSKDST
jgi:DNA repair protein RecO (recombination protein O)